MSETPGRPKSFRCHNVLTIPDAIHEMDYDPIESSCNGWILRRRGLAFIPCPRRSRYYRLALPLRLHCANAVDARGIALTNRFLQREEFRLTMQMRTASGYMIHLVILILRYGDRFRNWAR